MSHRQIVPVLALVAAACGDVAPADPGPDAGAPDALEVDAPPAAPSIAEVLDCGTPASAGGLASGTDLQRVDVDLTAFPGARCNDGTGATFFFRPAATAAGRGRWVIQLQGGGGCRTPDDCARRWCSIDTNFGMTQMTSALAPARGTIGDGILRRAPGVDNPLADANHVFVRYCSSDTWSGASGPIDLDAAHPVTGAPIRYRIEFNGRTIVDAVLATLRRDGAAPPPYTLAGGAVELPDLDEATRVLVAGASAGGGGVANNADHVADTLRAHNVACGGDTCPLEVVAISDSTFAPSSERLDWSTSTYCAAEGLCTWDEIADSRTSLWTVTGDASCRTWHAANAPDTAHRCAEADHVLRHHVTTPTMVRMGLVDQLISGNLIEAGVSVPGRGPMTLPLFAELVREELLAHGALEGAEERDAMTVPALFAPHCPKHETLSNDPSVYDVTVLADGASYTMFDVFTAWLDGGSPTQVVQTPGDPVDCD